VATGWTQDGKVQEQIDATVSDAVARARRALAPGPSLSHCAECGEEIPEGRRQAVPGVRFCVDCQQAHDRKE
jgi:phage/conjugal plasmid C-4 type zinc finger TraR family protein